MGLRTRLTAALLLLFLAVGAVLLVAVFRGSRLYFEEVHHRVNHDVAAHVAKSLRPFAESEEGGEVDQKELSTLFMDVMRINPSLEVYLLDQTGRILAYDAPEGAVQLERVDLEPVRRALANGAATDARGDDPRAPGRRKPFSVAPIRDSRHAPDGGAGGREGEAEGALRGYLYVILGGEAYREVATGLGESRMTTLASAFVIGSVLLAALIGTVVIGRLVRPLGELRVAMAELREGEEPPPLPTPDDEIGALAKSFQSMAARIAAQIEDLRENDRRRREFVAHVSHDLRTPIAAIGGYLEALIDRFERIGAGERQQFLRSALKQTERLGALVDQLFELARLEAREFRPEMELFSPAELVQDVAAKFRVAAEAKGLALETRLDPDLPPVRADIGLLERALDNLIGNAIRYTHPGGTVAVEARQAEGGIGLAVADSGPGIPREDLPRVFDRFYRVERPKLDAEEGPVDGTGLGLAIAKRIVELHDGRISVDSSPDKGTTFSVTLASAGA